MSTLGNSADFGDLTSAMSRGAACANSVRWINAGGRSPDFTNTINSLLIPTLGDAVDYGDLLQGTSFLGAAASTTRAVWAGGYTPSNLDTIQYKEFTSSGDTIDFGNLLGALNQVTGSSNGHGGLG